MASWDHFHREIAAGNAMRLAGNLDAAVRHCKASLEIAPDHVDAYELQMDILVDKDRLDEAIRLTQARLERVPDCRWAHLQRIRFNGQLGRAGFARKARDEAIALFADTPMMVHDANFMFDASVGRDRAVLKRIKAVRKTGYWGLFDLNALEQKAHARSGHITTLGRMQQKDLEDGFVDAETLHSQAKVRYLQGRLISARRLARQAADVDPANAPEYAETRFSATLGMVPLMWGAQAFIVLTGSLTSRFPWFLQLFSNYTIAVACIYLMAFILMPIGSIPGVPEAVSNAVIGTIAMANVVWALYVIWAWGSVGRWRSRKRGVTLSKDY